MKEKKEAANGKLAKFNAKVEWFNSLSLRYWILMCLGISVVLQIVLEILGRRSITAAFVFMAKAPLVYLYNIIILFFTLTLSIVLRKRVFGLLFILMAWLVCGFVNFTVLGYRITPFSAIDFLMATDVISMLDVYYSPFQQVLLFAGIIVGIILVVFIYIKSPKVKGKVRYGRNVAFCLVLFVAVYTLSVLEIKYSLISDDFSNLGTAYKDYGFAYCFSNSVLDVGMSYPDGYDISAIDSQVALMQREEKETAAEKKEEIRANIIIIQMESFIDISRVSGINCDKDPVPNFNKFMEEYPSGYLTVPSIGAGTANTEFEVITGMKSSLFGAGEYPYKTVLASNATESMAQILTQDGYGAEAIHNNKSVFYSRNKVYANLGFKSFTSLEYMYGVEKTSAGWAKDNVLVTEINRCLDSTGSRDLVFTISVQGHGRYPTESINTEEHVKVTRDDGDIAKQNQFGYYVNQTYEMDEMLCELKKSLDERGEKYVLFIYGDHIPSLEFEEGQITEGTDFQTEYVMVNNLGLKIEDQDLYSYEVSDYILSALNLPKGYMQWLHSKYYNKEKEEAKEREASGEEAAETESEYAKLAELFQYDLLYGEGYARRFEGKEPYQAADMKMGILKIEIDGVKFVDGEIIVQGSNFNEFSQVIINDKRLETEYIDAYNLKVISANVKKELKEGDKVCVGQIDKEKHELSRTREIEY